MIEPKTVHAWTRRRIARLAQEHFPGRAAALEAIVRDHARRHEDEWRSTSVGIFRPTSSMYALALAWELGRRGPTCAVCHGTVEVPLAPHPSAQRLALGLHTALEAGGLNVPQNLSLRHEGCGAGN